MPCACSLQTVCMQRVHCLPAVVLALIGVACMECVHTEGHASLAQNECPFCVHHTGAVQTMERLLKPDTRAAAITMLGKTLDLCPEKVSFSCVVCLSLCVMHSLRAALPVCFLLLSLTEPSTLNLSQCSLKCMRVSPCTGGHTLTSMPEQTLSKTSQPSSSISNQLPTDTLVYFFLLPAHAGGHCQAPIPEQTVEFA